MFDALPAGFYGTRADVLMDVIITIVALVPVLLTLAFGLARGRRYAHHAGVQVLTSIALAATLLVFEIYVRARGGLDGLSQGSPWHQTPFLQGYLAVHLVFAVSSTLIWFWLLIRTWGRFGAPPTPGAFSATHRRWGRLAMAGMLLTAITGLGLYGLCFVA